MEISRSAVVHAPATSVYDLVSDLPRMGELSNENVGGRWLGDASGPVAGARFRGHNRNGFRRWSTTAKVVVAERGREFTFDVSYYGVPVSRWSYLLAEAPDGCTVTEAWADRRPWWFKTPAGVFTGVMDRQAAAARGIEHTLARVKGVLEAS